jgi:cbb3-type cytochrome oxidase subunit 3
MVLGTAFTLFFVPAIYVLLARDHRGASQEAASDEEALPAAAEVAS